LKRSAFANIVQEFYKCTKSVVLNSDFEIGKSTNLRKVNLDEFLEVIEGPREDTETQLTRARVRAVRDSEIGWVSVKGNKGTPFLIPAPKPFMQCVAESGVPLHDRFAENASVLKTVRKDEVLELLEGPRESTGSEVIIKASALNDDKTGWVTVRDMSGTIFASPSEKIYTCKAAIAMTDNLQVKLAKPLRKLAVGELLELIDDDTKEDGEKDKAVQRVNCRALRDGKEGWITSKGNQGTIFLEPCKTYRVEREAPLRERVEKSCAAVRTLEVGEVVKALGNPREERPAFRKGVRVRSCEDGSTGWVLFFVGQNDPLRPWTSQS